MSHKKTINDLDKLYSEAESCDSEIFAEMRSNILLIAGEHYNKNRSSFFNRIRDSKQISEQQKIRLTKNHIGRIHKTYANTIIAAAPNVGFEPKDQHSLQDQKASELHHSVWMDAWERYSLESKRDEWCDSFLGIGEVFVKEFWDPHSGAIKHLEQEVDKDGNPVFLDSEGRDTLDMMDPETLEPNKLKPGNAVHEGAFVFEEIYGFNLLRSPDCQSYEESPYLIVRKMMSKDVLTAKFKDKKEKINSSSERTMVVFDPSRGGYAKADNQVMVREHYFRPCQEYPTGYVYITIKDEILDELDLPGGVWPFSYGLYEKIQTTPRGRSPVKQMRPFQVEINRSASKMAEHQITLGDDKIIMQNGSKISASASYPGVRALSVTGQAPTILAGRDGSQYSAYNKDHIAELYEVMGVTESTLPASGNIDPFAMLFMAASKKLQFQRPISRFERFLVSVAKVHMQLAKIFMPEDMVVYAVGKNERVNIAEFKNSRDVGYVVKVKPQTDDLETKLGKQIAINHLVQYTGANMSKEDLGKLIRLMPYANMEEGLSDLTLDYDSGTNDILAMDRGESPSINQYDNHVYLVKRAVSRMRQPDFKFLPPNVQQIYQQYVMSHEQAETQRTQEIQKAQSGFIPTGGYMVVCDLYVSDPNNPEKTKRARIPYEAVKWLLDKLETQGQSQEELEKMNQGAVAQMAQMLQERNAAMTEGMARQRMAGQPQGE